MVCKALVLMTALFTFCASFLAHSQQLNPPCQAAEYRGFDFWLGHWEVRTADGQLAGENRITSAEQGCVLLESWRSANGNTGRSYNFFDPVAKAWRQVWISPGSIIDIQGGLVDGSMRLAGHIVYTQSSVQAPFRGTWTPLQDGRVRQHFEQQGQPEAQGEVVWQTWFDGFYTRKPSQSSPPAEADAAGPS